MFLDSVGIILRKNDLLPYKMVILDKIQGKIECVGSTPHLPTGSLITYTIKKQGLSHFVSDSTLIYIPLSLASADMLFFHHVLELIHYFTNIGNCFTGIFDLIAFLYTTEHATMTTQAKKIFLLRLLTTMGNVPEVSAIQTKLMNHLNTIGIDQLNNATLTISEEKELDRWLWCCVWQHPYVNEFKTVHFLAENRAL